MVNAPKRPSIPLERLPLEVMLRSVEPFCVLSELGVARVGREMSRVRKPARTIIVRDGSPADAAYIVLRGRVNLVRSADGTRDIILASLGPGEVFGEAAAIEHSRASTTALTATAVELVRVSGDCLRDLVRTEPQLAMRMMQVMSRRLCDVEAVASDLALCDVEERLRRTLSQLARRQGRPEPASEGWVLAPVPTQSELARMVGSCRETVSRTLSALAREGHLSSTGRRMFLKESFMTPVAVSGV